MSQGDTGVPLSSDRCHRAGFPPRLSVQCASWTRRCALGSARLLRPPSGSISTLISAEAALARHHNPSQTLEVRGLLASHSLFPRLRLDLSRRCVPFLRVPDEQLRAVPGRISLVDCRLPFNPWRTVSFFESWMNYWRVANKCEKKAEARVAPLYSVQRRKAWSRVVDDNGGGVPVSSFCYFADAM